MSLKSRGGHKNAELHVEGAEHTVFLLINAPTAMQNIDMEPLFCTQFASKMSVKFSISLWFRNCYYKYYLN